jgi:hypothetical protein
MANGEQQRTELEQFDAEFRELDADFVELAELEADLGPEALAEFEQLEQEVQAAGLEPAASSFEALTQDGFEGQADMLFLGNFLKKRARKLIQKLVEQVRKHRKCASCARIVAEAVRLFGQGKYAAALRKAYEAYRCIRKCLSS